MKCSNPEKNILRTCSTSGTYQIVKLVLKNSKTDRRRTEETCAYIFIDESEMIKVFSKICPSDKPWFIESRNL